MDRKAFLKTSCTLCLLGAAGLALPVSLTGCGASKDAAAQIPVIDGTVSVPLSRFGTPAQLLTLRPKGWDYDIAVQPAADGSYTALLLRCTHMDNPLYRTGAGWACSLHGSTFAADGRVRKGPAERALTRYRTEVRGESLLIHV